MTLLMSFREAVTIGGREMKTFEFFMAFYEDFMLIKFNLFWSLSSSALFFFSFCLIFVCFGPGSENLLGSCLNQNEKENELRGWTRMNEFLHHDVMLIWVNQSCCEVANTHLSSSISWVFGWQKFFQWAEISLELPFPREKRVKTWVKAVSGVRFLLDGWDNFSTAIMNKKIN